MNIDKIIQKRQSIRKFSKKKPDWRNIIEAVSAARYAPMAGNIFNLKFIIVDDKEKINKIAEYCQQDFVKLAQYIVVVCSNSNIIKSSFHEDSEKYTKQQSGAAIQNFILKLEDFGLSTCWIGLFNNELLKKELKIPEKISIEAVFPIGYADQNEKTRKKRKIDMDSVLFFNKFDNKKMKEPR
jgi:nitroreductase